MLRYSSLAALQRRDTPTSARLLVVASQVLFSARCNTRRTPLRVLITFFRTVTHSTHTGLTQASAIIRASMTPSLCSHTYSTAVGSLVSATQRPIFHSACGSFEITFT